MNDELNNQNPENNENNESSEYEVSFDSTTGDYSYIPAPGNGFSLNSQTFPEAKAQEKNQASDIPNKKKSRSTLVCITAIVVAIAVIICALSAGVFALSGIVDKLGSLGGLNDPSNMNSISGTKLTVSKSDLDVAQNAVSKATYAAYDSTLLIEAYADSSASELAGTGSGVLWTADGYVVTCNHVVEGYSTIKVTFTDGTSYFAESMATDPLTDLAVLKITLAEGSEVLPVTVRDTSKSPLMLGETVIAIGNPLGYLTNTVTDGILSSLEREISVEGTDMLLMQISAAVNSGNSGGGLFDINGSLIGIVNAKISGTDVEGIGFAIPIDTVVNVITQLADKGYVSGRPQIGIEFVVLSKYNYREVFSEYPDLEKYAVVSSGRWGSTSINPGIYIVGTSESIKYLEGTDKTLEFGDRIYLMADDHDNSIEADGSDTIQNFLADMKVGDTIHITVMRGGKAITVSVVLGEKTA